LSTSFRRPLRKPCDLSGGGRESGTPSAELDLSSLSLRQPIACRVDALDVLLVERHNG